MLEGRNEKFICKCLMVWLFPVAYFWLLKGVINPIVYSLVLLHGWYNVFSVVVSFIIGKRNYFGIFKWLTPLVIGVMNAVKHSVTFGLLKNINTGTFDSTGINVNEMFNHAILSVVGLVAGIVIRFIANHIKEQEEKGLFFNIPSWMWGAFIAWLFPIMKFWILNIDTAFFSLFLYIWYMMLAFCVSVLIGRHRVVEVYKWLQLVILLLMNLSVYPLTVGFAVVENTIVKDGIDVKYFIGQVIITAVGFFIGKFVRYIGVKKR